jgi:hypothetical protein
MTKTYNGSQWDDWVSLGGTTISPPTAVASSNNRLDVFYRGVSNEVYHRFSENGTWSGNWTSLGGEAAEEVVAVSTGPGKVDMITRDINNAIYGRHLTNGNWTNWVRHAPVGSTISRPAIVAWGQDKLTLARQGPDNRVYRRVWDRSPGPYWNEWDQVGDAVVTHSPSIHPGGGDTAPMCITSERASFLVVK